MKKKLATIFLLGSLSLILCSCMAVPVIAVAGCGILSMGAAALSAQQKKAAPQLTPLEIQNIQSRTYEASKDRVFASVVSVLQDHGYTISDAHQRTGVIKGKSLLQYNSYVDVTAFIQSEKNKTTVRLSFVKVEKITYRHHGAERNSTQLLDAALYQNVFEQIDSDLFVRSSQH